jgi:hypothetical protein
MPDTLGAVAGRDANGLLKLALAAEADTVPHLEKSVDCMSTFSAVSGLAAVSAVSGVTGAAVAMATAAAAAAAGGALFAVSNGDLNEPRLKPNPPDFFIVGEIGIGSIAQGGVEGATTNNSKLRRDFF